MDQVNIPPYLSYNREVVLLTNTKIKDLKEQISQCRQIKKYQYSSAETLKLQAFSTITLLSDILTKLRAKKLPPLQKGLKNDFTLISILTLLRKLLLEIYANSEKIKIIEKNLKEVDEWLDIEEALVKNI